LSETKWMIAREIPHLRRYALALAGDAAAADDLVQDALERAIRKRHLWSRRGSIRGWLYRILYHVFLNQTTRRRRVRAEVGFESATEALPLSSVRPDHELSLACRDIAEAMRALPVEQRAAIALTAVEGLSYDEAAEVLDVPLGTLRSRLSRGRERLRELYSGEEPGEQEAPRLRRVK
jgi:RNA polymerase sigma-70 factor (ECF subfamily)